MPGTRPEHAPDFFFQYWSKKQHAPKNEAKPTHPDHAQNTPHIFLKINMPINAIPVILLLFSTCLTRPRTHPEHAQNTPKIFFKKMKQKQHAQNTHPKIKQNQHTQNTPHIFSKIHMPINAIPVILLLFSTCLATMPRTRPEHAPDFLKNWRKNNTPGTRPEHAPYF